MTDALIDRKNLHTLTVSISNAEDMETLTQLAFLVHLNIILDHPFGDKSTVLKIAHNLQHFPHLQSFTLIAECDFSNYDKQEILSMIFDTSPARDIRICLSLFRTLTRTQSEFKNIVSSHTHGILFYRWSIEGTTCSIRIYSHTYPENHIREGGVRGEILIFIACIDLTIPMIGIKRMIEKMDCVVREHRLGCYNNYCCELVLSSCIRHLNCVMSPSSHPLSCISVCSHV